MSSGTCCHKFHTKQLMNQSVRQDAGRPIIKSSALVTYRSNLIVLYVPTNGESQWLTDTTLPLLCYRKHCLQALTRIKLHGGTAPVQGTLCHILLSMHDDRFCFGSCKNGRKRVRHWRIKRLVLSALSSFQHQIWRQSSLWSKDTVPENSLAITNLSFWLLINCQSDSASVNLWTSMTACINWFIYGYRIWMYKMFYATLPEGFMVI